MSSPNPSLADIVGPWEEPGFESGLIDRMRAAWSKPLQDLTNRELATCLRQRLAVEDVLPIAKKRVSDRFDDDSELHDTELAEAIEDAEYWCRADDEDRHIRGLPARQKGPTRCYSPTRLRGLFGGFGSWFIAWLTADVRHKMKKTLITLVTLVAAVVGGVIGKTAVQKYFDSRREVKIEAALHQAEAQINATVPKMVDAVTRLDGAKVGPGKRLVYIYTLIGHKAADIDMALWRNQAAPEIRKNIKAAAGMRTLFELGTVVTYRYSGSDGVLVDEIVVTPGEVLQK